MMTRHLPLIRWNLITALLLAFAIAAVLLHTQVAAQSAAVTNLDPLPYSRGFLITGNYVAGGDRSHTAGKPARRKRVGNRHHFDERRSRRCEHRRCVSLLGGDIRARCESGIRDEVPRFSNRSVRQLAEPGARPESHLGVAAGEHRDMLGSCGPEWQRNPDHVPVRCPRPVAEAVQTRTIGGPVSGSSTTPIFRRTSIFRDSPSHHTP